MMTFDVPHVFRVFGGPRGLMQSLDTYQPDHGLSYNAIQMWLNRKQIPARWVGLVLYIITQEGHSCAEFLIDLDELG